MSFKLVMAEARRNGTAGAAMPIRTIEIRLDDIGYPDWSVTMRTNPRSSVYEALVSGDESRWWPALGQIVLDWNLQNEDGSLTKLPREADSEKDLDLPIQVLSFVLDRWFEAVKAAAAVPKASSDNSAATSSTSAESPRPA